MFDKDFLMGGKRSAVNTLINSPSSSEFMQRKNSEYARGKIDALVCELPFVVSC